MDGIHLEAESHIPSLMFWRDWFFTNTAAVAPCMSQMMCPSCCAIYWFQSHYDFLQYIGEILCCWLHGRPLGLRTTCLKACLSHASLHTRLWCIMPSSIAGGGSRLCVLQMPLSSSEPLGANVAPFYSSCLEWLLEWGLLAKLRVVLWLPSSCTIDNAYL